MMGGVTNMVPSSIDTDGSVFNGTGYKEGYRLSSSGAEQTQDESVLTGYIPAKPGDVVRMAGATWGTTVEDGYCYIGFFDESFVKLATVNRFKTAGYNGVSSVSGAVDAESSSILTDSNGVTTFDIVFTSAVDFAYIRISATGNGENMIVTVNEEIT